MWFDGERRGEERSREQPQPQPSAYSPQPTAARERSGRERREERREVEEAEQQRAQHSRAEQQSRRVERSPSTISLSTNWRLSSNPTSSSAVVLLPPAGAYSHHPPLARGESTASNSQATGRQSLYEAAAAPRSGLRCMLRKGKAEPPRPCRQRTRRAEARGGRRDRRRAERRGRRRAAMAMRRGARARERESAVLKPSQFYNLPVLELLP